MTGEDAHLEMEYEDRVSGPDWQQQPDVEEMWEEYEADYPDEAEWEDDDDA